MQVLNITSFDCAGVGWLHKQAINAYTNANYRTASYMRSSLMVEVDLSLQEEESVRAIAENANVLQFNPAILPLKHEVSAGKITSDGESLSDSYGGIDWREYKKPKVAYFHGSSYLRENYGFYKTLYKDFALAASTPDIAEAMGAYWLPAIVEKHQLCRVREFQEPLIVCQSPTWRPCKNTEDIIAVIDCLQDKGYAIELHLIEGVTHDACLMLKAWSDVSFDHLQGYYGVSSLEAMSMGMPNIVSLSDTCLRYWRKLFGTEAVPFLLADTPEETEKWLVRFFEDKHFLERESQRVIRWMDAYYSPKKLAERQVAFYAQVCRDYANI